MTVLFARSGGLGDCIITLFVAQQFRLHNPSSVVHVLGNGTMCEVARLSGLFDELHFQDSGEFFSLYSFTVTDFLRDFFSRYDRIYFYSSSDERRLRETLTECSVKQCRILDPRPPSNLSSHITEYLSSILETTGGGMTIPSMKQVQTAGFRHDLLIHPGSGSPSKNWPLTRFMDIAKKTTVRCGFILGPAEIERGYQEKIDAGLYDVICPGSIEELAHLLSESSLYIGNDSGVSHLAAVCGVPVVVLFGPTDPTIWRPLGKNVTVVRSSDDTMEGIDTETVNEIIVNLMKKR